MKINFRQTSTQQSILLRHKDLIVRSFILLTLVFIATQLIMPTVEGIRETQARVEDAKAKLGILTEKDALLKSANKQTLSAQARQLTDAVPQTIDLPLILATMQKIATDTEVELGAFSLSSSSQALTITSVEQGEKLSSFGFQVNLRGSFENILRFVERLGTVSPLLQMEALEFSADAAKGTVNYYFQLPLALRPAIDSPLPRISDKHMSTIREVSALEPPVLEEPLVATPSGTEGRENPFR